MVFSKIFGKSTPPDRPPREDAIAEADVSFEPREETDAPDESWLSRAQRAIVGGASTGSKRVGVLYGGDISDEPTHFVRASGCHIETVAGDSLIDCTMALGSVALGYAEPQLTRAVIETLASGSVSALSHALEVEVAERFCAAVPCAEQVQFMKTGAEAVSAAVRIARTYTGRDLVIGCGYFGWHDWSSDAEGVPDASRQNFRRIEFDNVTNLEAAAAEAGDRLAAIVLEPVVERLPSKAWIERARTLCDVAGAVLIFDEVKTGFRLATGGYQQFAEITPDLAAFGKAMANGYPLSAVCGNAELMKAAEKTWISSTLASEAGALAAANAVLDWHDRAQVCESLWSIGKEIRESVAAAAKASGLKGISIEGIDPMWFLKFEREQDEHAFIRAAVSHGVLFKRGAYNFAALAHDDDAVRDIEAGASAAFVDLRERRER
jgi:glutamate-1-semialdehyde 2,1-aminomutase